MSFDDPLAQGNEETETAPTESAQADPQASLAGIEAILRGMANQIDALAQDVETLKAGDGGRPARAALPAVESPLEAPHAAAADAPAGSAEAAGAAAERARLEAERLEEAARAAKERAQAAAEEASRAAEELAAAEGRLQEAASDVETREVARDRAEAALGEAEATAAEQERLLRDARVEQVQAKDFVEQARTFKGADAMVAEAERLLAGKDEEVQAIQAEVDDVGHRRDRAAETLQRAEERLAEARTGLATLESDVRRLRGEVDAVAELPVDELEVAEDVTEDVTEDVAEDRAPVAEPFADEVSDPEDRVLVEPFAPSLSELAEPREEMREETREEPVQPAPAAEAVADVDEDDIAQQARREREQLEAELRGETPAPAPAPAFEPFEEDEEARRLAEMTQAEIEDGDISDLGDIRSVDRPLTEVPSSRETRETEAPMPWEEPPAREPAPSAFAEPAPEAPMPWEDETPARRDEGYAAEPIETVVPGDHVPAYAELDETPMSMTPPRTHEPYESVPARVEAGATLPEPVDILYAIAPDTREDVNEPASAPARQAMQATRAATEDTRRGKKAAKPKFEALPFDLLIPKQPLVAAFFSPSGGVGKSSTTLNVAALMAAIGAKQAADAVKRGQAMEAPRVLALDGDVVQGSLALRLTGETKPSMHTLQLYLDAREDQGFVGRERWPQTYKLGTATPGEEPMQKFVHWPDRLANLNLLAAPDDPDKFFDFGPEEYRELLELLGQFFDVILIDCGTEVVMESNRAWLQHAHSVFMLCTPELDRIWNASKAMGYIAKSRPDPEDRSDSPRLLPPLVTREKVSIVMTSSDAETGINLTGEELVGEFFPYIDERQRFFIPDVGRELRKANNAHDFLVLNDQRFAKSIMDIAKHAFNRYASSTRALGQGS